MKGLEVVIILMAVAIIFLLYKEYKRSNVNKVNN